jgi:hypothetical protein
MKKVIIVTMPDSSQWEVPCNVIAEDRADYYSDVRELNYDSVYDQTIENNELLISWAENEVNWHNVRQYAKMIKEPNIDYEEGWESGYKIIKEI